MIWGLCLGIVIGVISGVVIGAIFWRSGSSTLGTAAMLWRDSVPLNQLSDELLTAEQLAVKRQDSGDDRDQLMILEGAVKRCSQSYRTYCDEFDRAPSRGSLRYRNGEKAALANAEKRLAAFKARQA